MVHTQCGVKCKVIECDGAAEFVGSKSQFGIEAAKRGIIIRPSMPHCPEQNYTPESTHDVRGGITRTIRIAARLPKQFWAEANRFAAYCIAYTVKKGQTKTPFERLLAIKPSFKYMFAFGSHAFAFIPKANRKKLDSKTCPCIYLGPSDNERGFRCYDPWTKKIFVASTCLVMEDSFGIQQLMEKYKFEKGRGYEHYAPGHDDWQDDQDDSDESEHEFEYIHSGGGCPYSLLHATNTKYTINNNTFNTRNSSTFNPHPPDTRSSRPANHRHSNTNNINNDKKITKNQHWSKAKRLGRRIPHPHWRTMGHGLQSFHVSNRKWRFHRPDTHQHC